MNEQSTLDILNSNYLTTDEKAIKIFVIFDKDKSGTISISEFIAFWKRWASGLGHSDEEMSRTAVNYLDKYDIDNNGALSLEELKIFARAYF